MCATALPAGCGRRTGARGVPSGAERTGSLRFWVLRERHHRTTSDLDILIVRDTELGIVDRVADLAFAARTVVALDLVVVTPEERETTFSRSSFGRTVLSTAQRIYAA